MTKREVIHRFVSLAVLLALSGGYAPATRGQSTEPAKVDVDAPADDSHESARREILDGARWRQTQREFNEWLSVQTIYTPDEVKAIRDNLRKSIANKSPRELEDFMKDMESRLEVLMSPEADDARLWLKQFMAVAVDPERQLGRARPDVLNMTASQIRQELQWLQQTREARQRNQASFNRSRQLQSQAARDARSARQQPRAAAQDRSAWPANNPRRPSQYAPQPELLPPPAPEFRISHWNHPIYWSP
jgi:hypothetical protein